MFKVYIRCYTYNHSLYIEDAMNGFVMQKTDFPFVATIVDDASTDETQSIITTYIEKNLDTGDSSVAYREETDYGTVLFARHQSNLNCFFAVVLLKENHYSQRKSKLPYLSRWIDNVPYVALCEGDDYWINPAKLQKQVAYLEAHPDCMLTVHSADWRTGDNVYPQGCQDDSPKDYSVEDLILCGGYHFATASFVYRSELNNEKPDWRLKARVGDFPLQILAGLQGKVHYFPDKMCVYRYQSEGSWSLKQKHQEQNVTYHKNKIKWMTLLNEDTVHKYQDAIYDQLFQHYQALYTLREIGLGDYLKATSRSGKKRYGRVMKDFLRVEISPIYRLLTHFKRNKEK